MASCHLSATVNKDDRELYIGSESQATDNGQDIRNANL